MNKFDILPANERSEFATNRPEQFEFMRGGEERATGVYKNIHDCCERRRQQSRNSNCDGSIRQIIRHKRQQLDTNVQEKAAQKVAARLSGITAFNQSQNLACYLAVKGELNTTPIIEAIWRNGKTCYLPVLDPKLQGNLCFVRYRKGDILVNNHYAIPEPVMENNVVIAPKDLDIVFMPLVAFDASGNRLGQGAGYYDRTFSFKLGKRNSALNPLLIGMAYEWQKVADLDASSWDVPLDMVITDDNLYRFW